VQEIIKFKISILRRLKPPSKRISTVKPTLNHLLKKELSVFSYYSGEMAQY